MTIAEWIIMVILAVTLFIFLVLGIVLLVKLIQFTKEAQKIVITGQHIADKSADIVENVKGFTSVGSLVGNFVQSFTDNQANNNQSKKGGQTKSGSKN